MPPTIKELFRWCLFFYLTNSTIGPIIRKKASYLITDLIYSTTSLKTQEIWKSLLEKSLKIREFEFVLMIDFEVFGNAYASIIYPFDRFLICSKCDHQNLIGSAKWVYDGSNFIVTCKKCKTRGKAKVKDIPVRNRNRVRMHRWYPMYIEPKKNPITGKTRYIYRIPNWIKKKVKDQKINKIYVEDTPLEFLEAIKKNQVIELDPDNLYHFKHESVSMDDDSLGIPQILNIMKDAWLYSTYNKSQEAVALEHVLPLDLISPAPAAGAPAPHMSSDLGTWRGKIQNIISNWRRDPNALFPVPFPVQVSRVRGDAQALTLHNDLQMVRQQIAGGLDVPPDFVYGNMTWCHHLDHGLVTTDSGLLYLREMVPEEEGRAQASGEIPGHEESSSLEIVHNTGQKRALKITTDLGSVAYPSHDHRYYRLGEDLRPDWVRAEDLSEGDFVGLRVGADLWPETPPQTKKVEVSSRCREVRQPDEMDLDLAALAGAMVAEGSLTGKSAPSIGMDDEEIIRDLAQRADRIFGTTHRIDSGRIKNRFGDGIRHCFAFEKTAERRFLEENLGMGYSKDKRVPSIIRRSPRPFVIEFLRYLYEGDGSPGDVLTYASSSEMLCLEIQAMLINLGIIGRLYPGNNGMFALHIFGQEMKKFRDVVGFVSDRKRKRLDDAVSRWERGLRCPNVRDVIPGGREALVRFDEEHRIGKLWAKDHTVPAMDRAEYSVKELASITGRGEDAVRQWIRKGLKAHLVRGESGRFDSFRISACDFAEFVKTHGLRKRVHVKIPQYSLTREKIRGMDLSYIIEKDPDLAENLVLLAQEEDIVWIRIRSTEDGGVVPTGDLTVEGTHSYLIDGMVVHNSGGNVTLRVLENLLINRLSSLEFFIKEWVVPRMRRFFLLPACDIRHQEFKMADDVQQKRIAMELRATNTVSDQTVLEELGFDPAKEEVRKAKEMEKRLGDMRKQQIAQAEIESDVTVIRAQAESKISRMQQEQAAQAQGAVPQEGMPQEGMLQEGAPQGPAQQAPAQGQAQRPSPVPPEILETQVMNFLKSVPPEQREYQLNVMGQQNPMLARAVRSHLLRIDRGTKEAFKPPPEQKPPRRGPDTATV